MTGPEPEDVEPMTWEEAEEITKEAKALGLPQNEKYYNGMMLDVFRAIALARRERERADKAEAHAQSCSDDLAFLDKAREENRALKDRAETAEEEATTACLIMLARKDRELSDFVDKMVDRFARADALAFAVEEDWNHNASVSKPVMKALRAYREWA